MAAPFSAQKRRIRPTDGGADLEAFGGATDDSTGSDPAAPFLPRTFNAIVDSVMVKYLATLEPENPPHPYELEAEVLELTNAELRIENAGRIGAVGQKADANAKNQLPLMRSLLPSQVARILVRLHRVVRLIPSRDQDAIPSDNDPLLIYHLQSGTYLRSNDAIAAAASKYSTGGAQFFKDVMAGLRVHAPQTKLGANNEWAAVANGDYHRASGQLHPFSPDRVFLSRVPVAYIPDAQNPVIRNPEDGTVWDVDSGIREIADGDPGTEQQLWELFASVAQPNVRTNRAVALYNPAGNNGKGTVLQVCRALAGEANTLNASIATLAKDATLSLLSGKALVVSDENATNDFLKNAETVKMLATREAFFVNPKYQQPYNATFEGTQVHCLNALPRFGDHTDSMWRRWLFIALMAEFEGRDRKYIKDDYIHRPEVLQYILRRSLTMKFTGFSETDATRDLLKAAKLYNDAVRQFWEEHKDEFAYDLLPLEMLYEFFKAWFARNKPGGRLVDRSTFDESIRAAVKDGDSEWTDLGRGARKKASVHMRGEEPLINEYGLDWKWRNVAGSKQYRNVLFRDRVALALATTTFMGASPAVRLVPASPTAQAPASSLEDVTALNPAEKLAEIERLVVEDKALWERRAVEDDGVSDATHVAAHAKMRRLGTGCGGCKIRAQRSYDDSVIQHSRDLDVALIAAQAALSDQAA